MKPACSRSWLSALGIALGVFFAAVPGAARAPLDQYGAYDKNSVRVFDEKTRLDWLREPLPVTGLVDARARCANHPRAPGRARLATVKELLTTVDEELNDAYENRNVGRHVDLSAFPETPSEVGGKPVRFLAEGEPGVGHLVDFATGEAAPRGAGDYALYARCVGVP